MKLDIQRFSGGCYDYSYEIIDEQYVGRMYDIELNDLMKDLVPLLKELEWWQSGDTSEEDYRKAVKKFKNKWFTQERKERLKELIDTTLDEKKQELYIALGVDDNE